MHAFKYHRPSSVDDAAALAKGEAKLLAGGQTLVQTMKLRLSSPSDIIDLGTIKDLAGIKSDGKTVTIGAMTRHAEVAHSADVKKAIPALAALAGMIGDRQVRAMGTCGGSIANNDPAADYPAAVLALGATITTNKRKHRGRQVLQGHVRDRARARARSSPRSPSRCPSAPPTSSSRTRPRASPSSACSSPTSAAACASRSPAPARACSARPTWKRRWPRSSRPSRWPTSSVKQDGLNTDLHASAEYRAHLVTVMARRAVEAALK